MRGQSVDAPDYLQEKAVQHPAGFGTSAIVPLHQQQEGKQTVGRVLRVYNRGSEHSPGVNLCSLSEPDFQVSCDVTDCEDLGLLWSSVVV